VTSDAITVRTTIKSPSEAIFAILVDPTKHAAVDGIGWVRDPVDTQLLTASGQIFRMSMFLERFGHYEMANRVEVFDPPHSISWMPGHDSGDGIIRFGGWIWRYDLVPVGSSETEVSLTYDWSDVPIEARRPGQFPPFPVEHLNNSLTRIAELVVV
jgi:hypothetical protein